MSCAALWAALMSLKPTPNTMTTPSSAAPSNEVAAESTCNCWGAIDCAVDVSIRNLLWASDIVVGRCYEGPVARAVAHNATILGILLSGAPGCKWHGPIPVSMDRAFNPGAIAPGSKQGSDPSGSEPGVTIATCGRGAYHGLQSSPARESLFGWYRGTLG